MSPVSSTSAYIAVPYVPVSDIAGRRQLWSAIDWLFHMSAAALSVLTQDFASAGPTVWNSLRNPAVGPHQFRWNLKPSLLLVFRWECVRGVFTYSRYINVHLLTYLLTYLLCVWFAHAISFEAAEVADFPKLNTRCCHGSCGSTRPLAGFKGRDPGEGKDMGKGRMGGKKGKGGGEKKKWKGR